MRRRKNDTQAARFMLTALSVFCIIMIAVSTINSSAVMPIRRITGIFVTPVQKGINRFGNWISGFSENLSEARTLREENEALKERVATLTAENSQLVLDKEELSRLQGLLELKEQYSDYETVGARVISKGSGNWFSTFTIDKGSDDGIREGCNVLSGAGLVGIVTQTGPHWASIRSIIDDNSNVSAMISTTSDTCIIAGNLAQIDSGSLSLVKLTDDENRVHVGDKVVTSNISEKFLPGILIGYISELGNDANNLTKSGTITPVADFRHLQEVLVILKTKDYIAPPDTNSTALVTASQTGDAQENTREEET